jgi:hypothetical protein
VVVQRKAAIEYWNKFPLNTAEDVGYWIIDRNIRHNIATATSDVGSEKHLDEGSDRMEMEEMLGDGPRQAGLLAANTNDDNGHFQFRDDQSYTLLTTRQLGDNVDHSDSQGPFLALATEPPLQNPTGPAATRNPGSSPSLGSENPGFAFSAEFRQKFLW